MDSTLGNIQERFYFDQPMTHYEKLKLFQAFADNGMNNLKYLTPKEAATLAILVAHGMVTLKEDN